MNIFDKAKEIVTEVKEKAQEATTPAATPTTVATESSKLKVNTVSSNLNIRNSPSMDGAIVGKAAHNEIVTLISKDTGEWWKIRTDDGEEGYASAEYLTTA